MPSFNHSFAEPPTVVLSVESAASRSSAQMAGAGLAGQTVAQPQSAQPQSKKKLFKDRFAIAQRLGRGGFGTTYLAEDVSLNPVRTCVIKQLKYKVKPSQSADTSASLAKATGLPFGPKGPAIPHGGLKVWLFRTETLLSSG